MNADQLAAYDAATYAMFLAEADEPAEVRPGADNRPTSAYWTADLADCDEAPGAE